MFNAVLKTESRKYCVKGLVSIAAFCSVPHKSKSLDQITVATLKTQTKNTCP